MKSAYLSHASSMRHEMGADHPECPDRVAVIADRLLARGVLDFMDSFDAPLATEAQILRAHEGRYFAELRAQAPTEGYVQVDPDTAMNPSTWTAALHAAGAAVKATELVASGEYRRAFCNVRPPGHHAERGQAMGFCFFNNVAVGIRHALDELGLERVALVDFDVHHGNGSEDILAGDERVLMVGLFEHPLYPYSGVPPLAANMHNLPLAAHTGGQEVRELIRSHWMPALERFRPELIVISAGFDAHQLDPLGLIRLTEVDYAWITEQLVDVANRHAQGRIVSTLEGGYHVWALARSVCAHLRVLNEP